MDDRIKLAEAMSWRWEEGDGSPIKSVDGGWQMPGHPAGVWFDLKCPDPFTDANDDYVVLEWARQNLEWKSFIDATPLLPDPTIYKIGDYARAALKVIK